MLAPKMVIKLWCLPKQTEGELQSLHRALIENLIKVEVGVEDENDVIVLFPPDAMAYGLGSEILIELSHIPTPPNMRSDTLKRRLAASTRTVVKRRFPRAHVQGSFLWSEDFPSDD